MKKLLLALMFISLLVPSISSAGLKAPDVLDTEKIITSEPLSKYKVVGIRMFSTDDMDYENVDDEEMRKLKRELKDYQKSLARTLRDNLQGAGFEAFVIDEDAKDTGNAEMVIEGRFTKMDLGSAVGRFMFGFGAGQLGVAAEGSLVDVKTGDKLATFEHETTSGLDDRFDKWQMMGREVEDMADDIAEFVEKLR